MDYWAEWIKMHNFYDYAQNIRVPIIELINYKYSADFLKVLLNSIRVKKSY